MKPTNFRLQKWTVPAAFLASVGLLVGCTANEAGQEGQASEQITFAMSSPAMAPNWVAFAVAEENGYFEDENLEVDGQFLEASGNVLQAMEGGQVDIGAPTPETILPAIEQGQDIKMVYRWTRKPTAAFGVLEDSPIESVGDFEGKRLGVQSHSSGPARLAEASLVQAGLNPSNDVDFIEVNVGASALDALNRERVDGLMLYDSHYASMEQLGTPIRQIRAEGVDDLFATTFVATDALLEENPEAVSGFGRAWTRGQVWALENPEKAMEIMWERYPDSRSGDSDEEQMEAALAVFDARMELVNVDDPTGNKTWGEYDESQIVSWIEFAQDNELIEEPLEPSEIYTNEFVDAYNDFHVEELLSGSEPQDGE